MKNIKTLLLLHFALIIYSLSTVASKYASAQELFSYKFILYMGLLVLLLGIYAILWQQVLKKIDLTVAYINKGITIVWGLLLSYFLFGDQITINNIIGCLLIIAGVVIMSTAGEKHE